MIITNNVDILKRMLYKADADYNTLREYNSLPSLNNTHRWEYEVCGSILNDKYFDCFEDRLIKLEDNVNTILDRLVEGDKNGVR